MAEQAAALMVSAGGCAASSGTAGAVAVSRHLAPTVALLATNAQGLPCGASRQSRLAPHSKSVLKPRRVKAKPYGRAARGLDPTT